MAGLIKWIIVNLLNKGCYDNWFLYTRNLLFGGHSSKSLHCFIVWWSVKEIMTSFCMPKCPMTNWQSNVY